MALHCSCGGILSVVDSRASMLDLIPTVRRRRRCLACSARLTTYECSASDMTLLMNSGKKTEKVLRAIVELGRVLGEEP